MKNKVVAEMVRAQFGVPEEVDIHVICEYSTTIEGKQYYHFIVKWWIGKTEYTVETDLPQLKTTKRTYE